MGHMSYILLYTLSQAIIVESGFWTFQTEKQVFHRESSSKNTAKYCYTYMFFIAFKIVEQFQKRARLQRSVDLYYGILFDFKLVGIESVSQ